MNDYESMLIHHVAANILLITSNYGSCHRYGAVVLFIHDAPDIFVAIAKICDSVEGWTTFGIIVGFIPMILSWFYFRLLYFPWIIYGNLFHSTYPPHLSDMNMYLKYQTFFLSCLLVLHAMWFKMFLNIAYTYATKGEIGDKVNDVQASETNMKKAASPASVDQAPIVKKEQ